MSLEPKPAAVSARDLGKSYGTTEALMGVSFSLPEGTMGAVVGPDGAGKTTLIRILAGVVDPDAGNLEILGLNPRVDRFRLKDSLGYLSQRFSLYGELSVDENIEFFAELHGVADYRKRRDEVLNFTRLTPFRRRFASRLSGGMKQKLALACNLIHRPRLLLLDEPTTGVDPVSRRDFRAILLSLLEEGVTILMTTPYMDEAERCDSVVMLHKGRKLVEGDPRELAGRVQGVFYEVACETPREAAAGLRAVSWAGGVIVFGDRLHVSAREEGADAMIASILADSGYPARSIRRIRPGLEDVFISLTEEEERA